MHASETYRWLGITELASDSSKPLVENPGTIMNRVSFSDLLPPVSNDQGYERARPATEAKTSCNTDTESLSDGDP